MTGDASDGYKGNRKYDILKESKATDIEAGPPSPVVTLPPVVADKSKELGEDNRTTQESLIPSFALHVIQYSKDP